MERGCSLLRLPDELRPLLARPPMGSRLSVLQDAEKPLLRRVYAVVGDYLASLVLSSGYTPPVIVYDCRTRREDSPCPQVPSGLYRMVEAYNPPGHLCLGLRALLREASGRIALRIVGEDDMVALLAILEAPIGSYVAYGYPGVSALLVKVTPYLKRMVEWVVKRMVCVSGKC